MNRQRSSTYGLPPSLDEEPRYEYPESYTGFTPPSPPVRRWEEKEKQPTGYEATGGGPKRWTVPQKMTGTTSTTMPIRPTIPLPKFTLPERDVGRVKELRTEAMSTPMRGMRQEARRALSRIGAMEGPMAKEAYRGWTEGLGTGISSIASQATLQAEQLYGVERAEQIGAMMANFQAELNAYFASWGQKTTTTYQYGGAGAEGGQERWEYGAGGRRYRVID